jgi:hypothetical protein
VEPEDQGVANRLTVEQLNLAAEWAKDYEQRVHKSRSKGCKRAWVTHRAHMMAGVLWTHIFHQPVELMKQWRKEHPEEARAILHIAKEAGERWRKNYPEKATAHYQATGQSLIRWREENPEKAEATKKKADLGQKCWGKEHPEEAEAIRQKAHLATKRWSKEHPEEKKNITRQATLRFRMEHPEQAQRGDTIRRAALSRWLKENFEHPGVHWDRDRQRWIVEIQVKRKKIHLGRFKDKAEAIRARQKAELNLEAVIAEKLLRKNPVPGVIWIKKEKHWRAQIEQEGRRFYLGSFQDKDSAINARKDAETDLKAGLTPVQYQHLLKSNTSGACGVWLVDGKGWRACIWVKRKQIHLGYFAEKAEAIRARQQAELKYLGKIKGITALLASEVDHFGAESS